MKYTIAVATALATARACTSFDSALGVTDTYGDGCSWYSDGVGCGTFDGNGFSAYDMCCGCGGGADQATWTCEDASLGFTDTYGDGCSWYAGNESSCGDYDTLIFWADYDCCQCGGGSVTAIDTAWGTDSWGDGCEWYDSNADTCGLFDDEDFVANIVCSSCVEASASLAAVTLQTGDCIDTDSLLGTWDSFGDSCSWYWDGIGCGSYDTSYFFADEQCCGCGGGVDQATWSCTDASLGFTDSWGDGCSWYAGNESYCGDYDTTWFWAEIDCCECGAGWITAVDTANGATDSTGDGCDWYDNYPSTCGGYDDDDFWADIMCASCVQESSVAAVSLNYYDCEHLSYGATDSWGDGCSWYDDGIGCGAYDDWDFTASWMCCGCGGGWANLASCEDTDWYATDTYGDGCSWYTGGTGCGNYDDWDFDANSMCCGCGGGSTYQDDTCQHTSYGATDDWGDSCSWYDDGIGCGSYDDWDFWASIMCCGCGGGYIAPTCDDSWVWATDSYGDSCSWYDDGIGCGLYDDDDFTASWMCCGCMGDSWVSLAAKNETESAATNTYMYTAFIVAILAVLAW